MAIEDMTPDGFGDWPTEAQRAYFTTLSNGTLASMLRSELIGQDEPDGYRRSTITKSERAKMLASLCEMKFGNE